MNIPEHTNMLIVVGLVCLCIFVYIWHRRRRVLKHLVWDEVGNLLHFMADSIRDIEQRSRKTHQLSNGRVLTPEIRNAILFRLPKPITNNMVELAIAHATKTIMQQRSEDWWVTLENDEYTLVALPPARRIGFSSQLVVPPEQNVVSNRVT